MKKSTICIIIGLAIYSLFITINYNKLKLENTNINQEVKNLNENIEALNSQNENLKYILDEEKYNEEKGYYVSEEGIYLINEDRFIEIFDLNNIFIIDYDKLKMQIINNPIDKYEDKL